MVRKYLGHPNELFRNIFEIYCPLPLGNIREPSKYFIVNKSNLLTLTDGINRLSYLLYSLPENIYFPISIWKFSEAKDVVKSPHLSSIIIPRVKYVDEFSLIN